MSTGETPPSATARFTSPSNTLNNNNNINNTNKKYPGTPKSPMLNTNTIGGNRNSQARQRLLASKISAPRPINLPSLRREHAVGTEVPASSPSTSHGWGSSSSSPSTSFTQPSEINNKLSSPEQNTFTSPTLNPTESTTTTAAMTTTVESTTVPAASKVDPASSPTLINTQTPTVRAWAVPTVTQAPVQPPSTDFPTAAEAAGKKKPSAFDDKEYLKYASSDPNHTSWDEMVSEDLDDFSVDVVEFDDGTKVQVDGSEETSTNPVLPSDRFTDDYDRSYPPRPQHHNNNEPEHHHTGYKSSYRRSEDHGYNSRYHNSVHGNYDNRRHSITTEERRPSATNDKWTSRRDNVDNNNNNNSTSWTNNRRSSYDRKSSGSTTAYHPTLLQRPRRLSEQSFRSDHSSDLHIEHHTNPLQIILEPSSQQPINEVTAEITAAQREVMLTAAERAKKRRDEEEAEFEAARVRARQKADALAEQARLAAAEKEAKEPVITIEKKPVTADSKTVEKKLNKTNKSPPPTEIKDSNDKKRNSVSSSSSSALPPKSQQPTKPVEPAPPKIPDTSKPWNLVAAKKEVPVIIEKRPAAPVTSSPPAKSPKNETETVKETKPVVESAKPKDTTAAKPSESESSRSKETEAPVEDKKPSPAIRTVDNFGNPLTKDELEWEKFVSKIKTDTTAPIPAAEAPNDWNSYATRLQKSVIETQAAFTAKYRAANPPKEVEVLDYNQNEDWGTIPTHITQGRSHDRGWTRNDEEHGGNGYRRGGRGRGRGLVSDRGGRGGRGGRGRGAHSTGRRSISNGSKLYEANSNDYWRHSTTENNEDQQQQVPVIVEILKHEPVVEQPKEDVQPEKQEVPPVILSKKTRLTNLLKESTSPIFPDFIEKLAGKKPANMSFMVDVDESDRDITMMDHPNIIDTQTEPVVDKKDYDKKDDGKKDEEPVVTVSDTEKDIASVPEAVDETSATSSTTSTPPRTQFQQNGHTKLDSSSPRRMNVNPNFPVLVYQYPLSQQMQYSEDKTQTNGYNSRSKGMQQRPMGVYLMPQQQYITGNQYMVPYPQSGTGVQPIYYPALPWQQQQQQSQQHYNNGSSSSPRPHYEQRRPYNNNYNKSANSNHASNEWESYRYNNNNSSYQRGTSHRKRGGWSNTSNPRGRGAFAYQPRRYPDVAPQQHQQEPSSSAEPNL